MSEPKVIPIVTADPPNSPQPEPLSRLPTGILGLDLALDGGLPLGSLVEIVGKAHSGKTTLALQVLGQTQRAGLTAVYICGASLPPAHYLAACGVDVDALVLPDAQATTALGNALDVAIEALKQDQVVVVVDPLPAFPLESNVENFQSAMENSANHRKAQRAKALDVAYAVMSSLLRRRTAMAVLVNQERYNVSVMFGNPWEPTACEVTDHFPVRLSLTRVQAIKQHRETIGSRNRVRVKKHAGGTPYREVEFEILHHTGPDIWASVLDVTMDCGAVTRENNHYLLGNKSLGQGRTEAKAGLAALWGQGQAPPAALAEQLPALAALLPESGGTE